VTKWVETEFVVTTEIGTPIEPDNLRRIWYPLPEAADRGGCPCMTCATVA
jgi:hypothetical protein